MAVRRTVKTLLVPTHVAVILDTGLTLIGMVVMVSKLDLHTLYALILMIEL